MYFLFISQIHINRAKNSWDMAKKVIDLEKLHLKILKKMLPQGIPTYQVTYPKGVLIQSVRYGLYGQSPL